MIEYWDRLKQSSYEDPLFLIAGISALISLILLLFLIKVSKTIKDAGIKKEGFISISIKKIKLKKLKWQISFLLHRPKQFESLLANIEHLINWSPNELRAILFLHLIGPKKANLLFSKMEKQSKETLILYTQTKNFKEPHINDLLKVAQDLIFSLKSEYSIFNNFYYCGIVKFIKKADKRILADILLKLPTNLIDRFFLYCDSNEIKELYDYIDKLDSQKTSHIYQALTKIESAQYEEQKDPLIYQFLLNYTS